MSYLPEGDLRMAKLIRLREYCAKDKPKVLRKDFAFKEPLQHGWMLPYLLQLDELSWGRWEHWSNLMTRGSIGEEPIPEMHFCGSGQEGGGRKMLERCLNAVTQYGEWAGWSSWSNFDYFLDWILFGFGDPHQTTEPKPPGGCEHASERLYQLFNIEPLLAYPYDYFGDILAENSFGRRSGFFPTPMDVATMMVKMQFGEGEDLRTKTVCDPAIGTGRMLLPASNYSYRLYGNDISLTVLKACWVNGWLYAPWMVKPFPFLQAYESAEPEAKPIEQITLTEEPATVGQMELELV